MWLNWTIKKYNNYVILEKFKEWMVTGIFLKIWKYKVGKMFKYGVLTLSPTQSEESLTDSYTKLHSEALHQVLLASQARLRRT